MRILCHINMQIIIIYEPFEHWIIFDYVPLSNIDTFCGKDYLCYKTIFCHKVAFDV